MIERNLQNVDIAFSCSFDISLYSPIGLLTSMSLYSFMIEAIKYVSMHVRQDIHYVQKKSTRSSKVIPPICYWHTPHTLTRGSSIHPTYMTYLCKYMYKYIYEMLYS